MTPADNSPAGFLCVRFCGFLAVRLWGFTVLREVRTLILALSLRCNALLERQRLPRFVVVVGVVIVVGGFGSWCFSRPGRLTDFAVRLLPATDAGSNRLLGGGLLPLNTLRRGLDGVRGL